MTDERLHYIFQVGNTEHFFDDDMHYNWNDLISNSHLIKFYSPELELNILVSTTGSGILGYSINEGFSEFLIAMGVKLFQYDFIYPNLKIINASKSMFKFRFCKRK